MNKIIEWIAITALVFGSVTAKADNTVFMWQGQGVTYDLYIWKQAEGQGGPTVQGLTVPFYAAVIDDGEWYQWQVEVFDGQGGSVVSDIYDINPGDIPASPYDLTGDGFVNMEDYTYLMGFRNQPASACPECDLNQDGVITVRDARMLILQCDNPGCQ